MSTRAKAVIIVISSKAVCARLAQQGIPQGSKQRLGVKFPEWIHKNASCTLSCIRGLFDTDGCVFQDSHRIRGKTYRSMGIAFANNEPNIVNFFNSALIDLGLHPTQTSKHRIFLRRSHEIAEYFRRVGTSNLKHRRKFLAFQKSARGGVA